MAAEPADYVAPIDYRSDPAARLTRARELAEAYQIVLRVENGQFVGRGWELPAVGCGATERACVRATRTALTSAVVGLLEAGQSPPLPEFPGSPRPAGGGRRWAVRWARNMALATTGVCVVAIMAVAAVGAKTVVISGTAIVCLGLLVSVFGVLGRYWWAVGLGQSYLLICIIFVVMVNAFRLSPRAAYAPFLCVGVPYVIVLILATITTARREPRTERPWECEGCGYLLVGLNEPRCPECGRWFDPRRWAGMAAPTVGAETR